MTRKILLILFLLLGAFVIQAQETRETVRMEVRFESVHIRALPTQASDKVASVFRGNILEVVGRNLDGSWYEVRREGRMTNLGWIQARTLLGEVVPEKLPLTDFATGATGGSILSRDPGIGAFVLEGVALRDIPSRLDGQRILNIPPNVTIPVLERNQDASWVKVNYLGNVGWIISFVLRDEENLGLMTLPEAEDVISLQTVPVTVVPFEIQQEQLDRLRAYTIEQRDFALLLQGFWWAVQKGEVFPCQPPAFIQEYQYGNQDLRELPEIDRYTPRLRTAVEYMNESIAPLQECGVINPDTVVRARNRATNAKVIFDATLERLDILEETVLQPRR